MAMKRTVAIVEDEPAIRDNYAAAFTREGYVVRTYPNRLQAMTAFAARLPDLAVIDISLEDEPEGGFELCRQLSYAGFACEIDNSYLLCTQSVF